MLTKTAAVFKPFAVESSTVVFNGRLIVAYAPRTPAEIGKLIFCDYFTGERIAVFGNQGLTLGCMLVVPGANGDILHYWGTENVGAVGNTIRHMQTNDPLLLAWTAPAKVWTAAPQQKIFNTSVCFDGSRYFLAYETSEPYYGYVDFNIRWFQLASDMVTCTPYGNIYGANRYVACPWMHFSAGWYYMIYLVIENGVFKLRIARASDPSATWAESPTIVMAPSLSDELTNTSDWDCSEFQGNTYITYSSGNQGNSFPIVMDLKQAYADGPLNLFLASFF